MTHEPGWSVTQLGQHWLWSAWGNGSSYFGAYRSRDLAERRARELCRQLLDDFTPRDKPPAPRTSTTDRTSHDAPDQTERHSI